MATNAAAVTEAERLNKESIKSPFQSQSPDVKRKEWRPQRQRKRCLTFAFFSPKVPVEKI